MTFLTQAKKQILNVLKRRQNYRMTFEPQHAQATLADLKRFCRGNSSPLMVSSNGIADPLATGVAIGRQEVYNRIVTMINLNDAKLTNLEEFADED